MTVRVFENWSPEAVPCPRCRTLLPALDAPCPRCSREASAVPEPTAPVSDPVMSAPPTWTPSEQSDPLPQTPLPEYARVLPVHQRPRLGWIVVVAVLAAVVAGAAYGLHRITARSDQKLAQAAVTPSDPAASVDPAAPMTLSGIPIRPDELPAGWTAVPPDHDADPDPGTPPGCAGFDQTESPDRLTAKAEYEENGYFIDSEAELVATQAELRADLAQVTSPNAPRCIRQLFRTLLRAAVPHNAVRGVKVQVHRGPNGGPSNVVASVTGGATLAANGRSLRIYFDIVLIAGRRVESSLTFMRFGLPVDTWLRDPLVAAVAERTARLS